MLHMNDEEEQIMLDFLSITMYFYKHGATVNDEQELFDNCNQVYELRRDSQ